MTRRIRYWGIAGLLACTFGCTSPRQALGPQGTTTVHVVGPAGAVITGFIVQNGYRLPLEGPLPLRFSGAGVTEVVVRKTDPEATLALATQHNENTDFWQAVSQARSGVSGLRVRVQDGVLVDKLVY